MNTSLRDLMEKIESHSFGAYIDAASGFSVVQIALQGSELIKRLQDDMQESSEFRLEVYQRFLKLLADNDEPEYAHPHDVALLSYLYGMYHTNMELARLAVNEALKTPCLWWTKRLASYILEHEPAGVAVTTLALIKFRESRIGFAFNSQANTLISTPVRDRVELVKSRAKLHHNSVTDADVSQIRLEA